MTGLNPIKKRESNIILHIRVNGKGWLGLTRLKAKFQSAANKVSVCLPTSLRAPCSVGVLLTGDAQIKRMNRTFRNKDRSTNVLSFPQFEAEEIKREMSRQDANLETEWYLGDIAIAWQTVAAEARRDGKHAIDHATHLLIHGLLHLYGYDHVQESEAQKMEALEMRIMKKLGLNNPYL